MATDYEVVGKREVPGLDGRAPKTIHTVVFYRPVGDAARADHVIIPGMNLSDSALRDAIAAKERAKGDNTPKRISI